jgi:hypothetical protein
VSSLQGKKWHGEERGVTEAAHFFIANTVVWSSGGGGSDMGGTPCGGRRWGYGPDRRVAPQTVAA